MTRSRRFLRIDSVLLFLAAAYLPDGEDVHNGASEMDNDLPMLEAASMSPEPRPTSLPHSNQADKPSRKRQYQSTLEELFPIQLPSSVKKRKRVVDSESDSDNLDQIQLAPEIHSPSESEEHNSDVEDDSDAIIGPSTRRRKLLASSPPRIQSPRTPSPRNRQSPHEDHEDEELSEEVRDITSSARKAHVSQRTRDPQSRNKRKSKFQKSLESLRKKKQRLESDESEDESQSQRGLYDSDSDVDSVSSEDFVVHDEAEIPLEQMMEIPPEFTSVSYQGPQLNFKVVVQGEVYALLHPKYHGMDYSGIFLFLTGWLMVDNVNPVDPYFRVAYKSLERQVTGITDSVISSNSWRPWFIRTLKQRPEFESENIPGDITRCSACNVGKRLVDSLIVLIILGMLHGWSDYLVQNTTHAHSRYVSSPSTLISDIGTP